MLESSCVLDIEGIKVGNFVLVLIIPSILDHIRWIIGSIEGGKICVSLDQDLDYPIPDQEPRGRAPWGHYLCILCSCIFGDQ